MAYYRLYLLDGDGRFTGFEDFEATSDASALARAGALGEGRPAELWSLNRLVDRLPAGASAAAGTAADPANDEREPRAAAL